MLDEQRRIAKVVFALERLGLPTDSPLSVLCVELLPTRPVLDFPRRTSFGTASAVAGLDSDTLVADQPPAANFRPLSSQLGHYRILRTSPLTEVSEIC